MPRWHPSFFFPFPFVSPWVTRRKKKHCAYKWVLIYFCMRDACKYTLDTTNGRILCFSLDSGQIWEMGGGKMRRNLLKSTIDSEGGGRIFWRSKKKKKKVFLSCCCYFLFSQLLVLVVSSVHVSVAVSNVWYKPWEYNFFEWLTPSPPPRNTSLLVPSSLFSV